jgi:hypothetical protein
VYSRHVAGGPGFDLTRPARNERHSRAPFVKTPLAAAQRRIVGVVVCLFDYHPQGTADATHVAREEEHRVVGELKFI